MTSRFIPRHFLSLRRWLLPCVVAFTVPGAHAAMTDAPFGMFPVGHYLINNNTWGWKFSPGGHESVWSDAGVDHVGPVAWGAKYDWPVGDKRYQVKAFPSIISGWHWGAWSRDSGLPVKLADLRSVTASGAISVTNPGVQNVAYDCWFHTIEHPGNKDQPSDELMIWMARYGGAGPLGKLQGTVTIGGATWQLYKGELGWNVFSFVRTTNADSWTIDIRDFIDYLVSRRHWLPASRYLTSVQFGSEIFRTDGPGAIEVKDYRVEVK